MIIPDGEMWVTGQETLGEHLERRGVTRRTFLAFCASMAAVISAGGLAAGDAHAAVTAEEIAETLSGIKKPIVVWLQLQECTGCMESVIRSGDTTVEELILNLVSMDYNELLMAAAGTAADEALAAANEQPHILVVNGSIPLGENGAYTTIAGRSAESILRDSAKNATAIFAVGACAHWGSVQEPCVGSHQQDRQDRGRRLQGCRGSGHRHGGVRPAVPRGPRRNDPVR